jgi:NAD(P)-dependent dehydrogenase (short-subunit alcohol dehydrogenase family)
MKNTHFKNKVVLITGSSQGIGRTTAKLMLKAGAKVVINARSENRLREAYDDLRQYGDLLPIQGDMGKWSDVQNLINQTLAHFGKLDILICNAGIKFEDTFRRTTPETLQQIIQVNFLGKVFPIKAALEALIESKGSVILIGSLAGLYGLPGASIYSSSKMALAAMQQSLAQELAPHGIHVGLMYVGFTENDIHSGIVNGEGVKQDFPDRKMNRQPREVVGKAIMRMIVKRIPRKVMTPIGIIFDKLKTIAPGLLRFILKRRVKELEPIL